MTPTSELPGWFPADQIYRLGPGWYFGSPDALNLGPFRNRRQAARKSKDVAAELCRRPRNTQLSYVRRLLRAEWEASTLGEESISHAVNPVLFAKTVAVRSGEEPRQWARKNRFFAVSGAWFFATREQINVGPFWSRTEAEKHLQFLIGLLAETDADPRDVVQKYKHRLTH